jgi:hypothetical protein
MIEIPLSILGIVAAFFGVCGEAKIKSEITVARIGNFPYTKSSFKQKSTLA